MKTPVKFRKAKPAATAPPEWNLRLYIGGETPKSVAAFRNLKKLCEEHLAGHYHIEIVNLLKHPELAHGDQILALPAVVRRLPSPIRKIIGDLSDPGRVFVGLDFGLGDADLLATEKEK